MNTHITSYLILSLNLSLFFPLEELYIKFRLSTKGPAYQSQQCLDTGEQYFPGTSGGESLNRQGEQAAHRYVKDD